MRKDLITLTRQEHERLQVIRKVMNGELSRSSPKNYGEKSQRWPESGSREEKQP